MTSQFFASDLGCTPCECGVPGACTQEQLPSFLQWIPTDVIYALLATLLPFTAALVIALLSRALLKRIWQNAHPVVLRVISVLAGALFVAPIANWISNLNLVETENVGMRLFICALIAIVSVYAVLSIFDLKHKKTNTVGSLVGLTIVLVIVFLAGCSYKKASDYRQQGLETQIQQIVGFQNESRRSVLESFDITQKASDAEKALRSKRYVDLVNQMDGSQKFILYFRDYDGAHFTKQEFQNIASGNKFKEVEIYHNVVDLIVTADQLLGYVADMLSGSYKTDYYFDNRRVTDEVKKTLGV